MGKRNVYFLEKVIFAFKRNFLCKLYHAQTSNCVELQCVYGTRTSHVMYAFNLSVFVIYVIYKGKVPLIWHQPTVVHECCWEICTYVLAVAEHFKE